MKELWLYHPIYKEYKVSNTGCVIGKRGKIMIPSVNRYGYLYVCISIDSGKRNYSVHRLVAETFISTDTFLKQVNHKDGNKLNNNDWNLEWATNLENLIHAIFKKLKKKKWNPVKVVQATKDGIAIECYESLYDASKKTKVSYKNISSCIKGKRKTAGGFKWYKNSE